jgi:CheY-like chemotaxis protein
VLVVDDDEQFRALARAILRPTGAFEIGEAASIAECLESLNQRAVDAIVLDILLPDGDGISALGEIRQRSPGTKIITISGAEEAEIYLSVSADLGADASLSKACVSTLSSLLRLVLEH